MNLYIVHCGYYDPKAGFGIYENHTNILVVAPSFEEAKKKAKSHSIFRELKMHIDGLKEINAIDGYKLNLHQDPELKDQSIVTYVTYRELSNSSYSQTGVPS